MCESSTFAYMEIIAKELLESHLWTGNHCNVDSYDFHLKQINGHMSFILKARFLQKLIFNTHYKHIFKKFVC